MENRQLNEKESLELIAQMIRNTQQQLEKVYMLPFLIFGYITIITSVAVWYLWGLTNNSLWNLLWFAIPILGFPILFFVKRNKPTMVRTVVDKSINYVWAVCAGTVIVASFSYHAHILVLVALLIGIGTTITGLISKLRLLTVCGSLSILASLWVLPAIQGIDSILCFAAIFTVMQIIPGHILYYKGKK